MKAMYKRLIVLLAVLVLLSAAIGVTAVASQPALSDDPVCYEHGDVNSDGGISGEDAVYLLFASFGDLFDDQFPLEQNGDIDGNGQFTGDDAVYLLFASFEDLFDDQFPLKGMIHSYYDPIWTWDTEAATPTAQVSLKCGCGEPHDITNGIAVTPGTVKAPTCVATGSKEYTAKATYDGKEFENTVTITVAAKGINGHEFNGTPTCTSGVKCENCDYELPKLDHSYTLMDTEKVEGCKHTKRYQCVVCQDEIDGTAAGDVYVTHNFTATIQTEATCKTKGVKLLTCSVCGETDEEEIETNDSHTWERVAKDEKGVSSYDCAECDATKTAVEAAADGSVSANALKNNEVQLTGGTTVALDTATAEQLENESTVKITVEAVKADQVQLDGGRELSAGEKQQIGQNDIYNFSMTDSDGNPVSRFNGKVTVALPYVLKPGDDVNSIDVWYIADDGSIECVKGVYSNDYVTFETDHFSYYTVTRLTPAQRCTVYGHVEVTATKAATCTEDGYTKVYCQRCGVVVSEQKTGMLGHGYVSNEEKSKAATCDAPGLKVMTCQRCNHEKSEELKQLTHNWEKIETVVPDCTNKGYDKNKCTLCQAEKIDNEVEATGHAWAVAENGWQWSEDYSKATVTLNCTRESHTTPYTKVLTAAVTKDMKDSICLGGDATYKAKASFNKETFEDSVTVNQTGLGHTPDGIWLSTSNQHYQTCVVCKELVGAAAHQWERTVVTAATCNKAGSAIDKCAVCDKEQDVVIPATGEHTYVNGVCSACGYTSGACDHKTLTDKVFDLSEYGACEGSITLRSCACGKIAMLTQSNISCVFKEENRYDEENQSSVYKETCQKCGLICENTEVREHDKEKCESTWVVRYKVIMDGEEILNGKQEYDKAYHVAMVNVSTINLSEYGLCGGKLVKKTCSCGIRTIHNFDGEDACKWEYDYETGESACVVCGAVQKEVISGKEKDGCQSITTYTTTIYKEDEALLSFVDQYAYNEHNYVVSDTKPYGQNCEDGVYIEQRCADCGDIFTRYYNWCVCIVETKKIDTTGIGFCTDSVVVMSCLCGKEQTYELLGENGHDWQHDGMDPVTGQDRWICTQCDYTYTTETTPGAKDENCQIEYIIKKIYQDDKGHSFFFTYNTISVEHNYETSAKLTGDSCEDGVVLTGTCKDCGYSYTRDITYHEQFETEVLDLSDNTDCGLVVTLYACACGEQSYIETRGKCDWDWVDEIGTPNGYIQIRKCSKCELVWKESREQVESADPCKRLYNETYSFLKDEQELGEITYIDVYENHSYLFTFTLNPGATDCSGGYASIGTCTYCGEVQTGYDYYCYLHPVAREVVSTEDMCGQLVKVTYSCACGKKTDVDVIWADENSCQMEDVGYDEALQSRVYVCAICGGNYYNKYTMTPAEGELCKVIQTTTTIWRDKDGQVLATESEQYTWYNHQYIYTYDSGVEDCDNGYHYTRTCAVCGVSSEGDDYGCNNYLVERTKVYENDAICGAVYINRYACACGKEESYAVDLACEEVAGNGTDFNCNTCGLTYKVTYQNERFPNSCRVTVNATYTFQLAGQTVATAEYSWERNEHIYLHTYQLLGDSCEDGYTYAEHCAYCDYTWSNLEEVRYVHSNWMVEYYTLPEACCGGEVSVYSCACGEKGSVEYNLQCRSSERHWEEKDENGINHTFYLDACDECGLTVQRESYLMNDEDPCYIRYGNIYTFKLGDWEKEYTVYHISENHSFETVSQQLVSGASDCTGGVRATVRCKVCGHMEEHEYHNHEVDTVAETIDLSQYGSDCGATLQLLKCACGKHQNYVFTEDTLCDLDKKATANWIENVINESQWTSEGHFGTYSNSYTYICAVTDPACGMKIRMSSYWLKENCAAVQYETWQLGYDPATGTYEREITIKTGESRAFHAYEETAFDEIVDGKREYGRRYTCPDCESYYVYIYYHDEDGNETKYVSEAVNTLNNGEQKKYSNIYEYVRINGRQYISLDRTEYVYADGTGYWYQTAYTYDLAEGCYRNTVYTNSNGENSQYRREDAHHTVWSIEWIKDSTCTQYGEYVERNTCEVCGKITSQYEYESEPKAHYWRWNEEKQTYVCDYCNLESANSASGKIVMEDLTEDYTEGNYVIGYWNREKVEFNPYVSLILYNVAEDENDELILEGIDFVTLTVEADGVCGLAFSQEAVTAAAAAAIEAAGYTGDYAVRINFVPVNGADDLDYAITFNTLTAE